MSQPVDAQAREARLEERLGAVLRFGVRVSSVALALGLLLSIVLGSGTVSTALMTTGLVLLMATPVARVAMSVIEYGTQRDWTFFALTAVVLLELCAGIVAALLFHTRL